MDPTFLLACSLDDATGRVHVLVFRDQIEVGTWDVGYCGESLGDYQPVKFEADEGLPLSMLCGRCFEMIGTHRAALAAMA